MSWIAGSCIPTMPWAGLVDPLQSYPVLPGTAGIPSYDTESQDAKDKFTRRFCGSLQAGSDQLPQGLEALERRTPQWCELPLEWEKLETLDESALKRSSTTISYVFTRSYTHGHARTVIHK